MLKRKINRDNFLNKYRLLELFENDDGRFSLMRVGLLMTLVPVMSLWTVISIREFKLEDIPVGVYVLIGIMTGGKLTQTVIDKKMGK